MRLALAATLLLTALVAAVPSAGGAAKPACTAWKQRTIKAGLGSLENLEFDGTGGLLLSASGPQAIERLTPNGNVTTLISAVNAPGGQRLVGRTLYFNTGDSAQAGLTGSTDGTIDRFDLDTHVRTTFASGLTMPNGLAILPNGDFVVSRDIGTGTGITRVPLSDPAHPQKNWATLDDQNGMAVDPTGTWLYAVQTFTADSAVWRFRISNPSDRSVLASLAGPTPKGLDDMTIDAGGVLYIAANGTGEVIRLDPATGAHCVIASGLQNPSSLKFGRGPGWPAARLYVTSFDGTVRELTPPATPGGGGPGGGGSAGGGGGKTKDRVALSLRPKTVVTGRRTRFRFTVYRVHSGKRTRLAHARVKLGGRSTTTNRRGRAGLTLRFRHPGTKVARASRRGLVSASKSVRVRRGDGD
jgi:sugar lactone lactonase YvrE